MKAILLVAGYATRLYPLTLHTPKALLPINGKPIIDYIVEQINTIPEVDKIYAVTNHKFAADFEKWAEKVHSEKPIEILDDGTTDEENRLGAIGDILFTIRQKEIDDDLLIVAGDNFFTYQLKDYYDFFQRMGKDCICVKEFQDWSLLSQFGLAELDEKNKVIGIEEKPEKPKSNKVVYATYMYRKETVPYFEQYIAEGNKPDAPGYFLEWLYKKKDVYAYTFQEECYDIGTPKSYEEVCRLFEKN